MQLITGDGGFDFSVDFNSQEVMSLKLIFAMFVMLLLCNNGVGILL